MGRKVYTPMFRASFVNVFAPRKNDQGKDEYSVKMIFPKDADLTEMKEIVKEAAQEKWGNNPPKGLRNPFRDGNESNLEKYPEDKDMIVVNAKTTLAPPGVVNRNCQPIMDSREVYSGCYMIATVTAYAYDNKAKGVSFGLQNLMKVKDGEPLSARATAESDFSSFKPPVDDSDMDDIFG